jgi:transposase
MIDREEGVFLQASLMIKIPFTAEDCAALEAERYHHPHPKVQRKMEALYLKSLDLPHHLICRICRIGEPTLVRYLRAYEQGGLDELKQLGYQGRPSGLKAHQTSLEEHFRGQLPHTCAQARQEIEELTGVHRGLTQVRMFLRGLNMKYRKTGFVPGKANTPEKQAEQEDVLKKTSNRLWPRRKPASGWLFS